MDSDNEVNEHAKRQDHTRKITINTTMHRSTPDRLARRKIDWKWLRPYIKFRTLVVFVVIVAGLLFWRLGLNSPPLPKAVTASLQYPVYYPKRLPVGYALLKNSAQDSGGILFYTIASGTNQIAFSEQAQPAKPPNLTALTKPQNLSGPTGVPVPTIPASFQTANSPAGQAVQGTSTLGNPVALILTGSTLISISGSKNLPTSALTTVVQSLAKIK